MLKKNLTVGQKEKGGQREISEIPNLSEDIFNHFSFLAFKNAQLVFSPQAAGTDLAAWGHGGGSRKRIPCKTSSSLQIHEITSSEQQYYQRLSDSKTSKNTAWMMFLRAKWVQYQYNCLTRERPGPFLPQALLSPLSNCRRSHVRSDKEPQRTKCLSHLPEAPNERLWRGLSVRQ